MPRVVASSAARSHSAQTPARKSSPGDDDSKSGLVAARAVVPDGRGRNEHGGLARAGREAPHEVAGAVDARGGDPALLLSRPTAIDGLAGEVHDGVGALEGLGHCLRGARIEATDLDSGGKAGLRGVAPEGDHPVSPGHERPHDFASDEAGRPGNRHYPLHRLILADCPSFV